MPMKSKIFINGIEVIGRQASGRRNFLLLRDGVKLPGSGKYKCKVECTKCTKLNSIILYRGKHSPLNKAYVCRSCQYRGQENPFYGRKHSDDFKFKLSTERRGTWGVGSSNAMFGVNLWNTYSEEKAKIIKEKINA